MNFMALQIAAGPFFIFIRVHFVNTDKYVSLCINKQSDCSMKNSIEKLMLIPALLLCSCTLEEVEDIAGQESRNVSHDMIILGDKLEDPYSLSNVEAALTKVYPSKAGRVIVDATDLYVRFLPVSEREYNTLTDLGLNLTDHPLDYEILQDGDYYHDPSLPDNAITWQYAVVSPDFHFPTYIRYEILDECYIPDNGAATRADDGIDWDEVEREAFRLTGHSDMLLPEVKGESGALAPKGTILIKDDRLNEGEACGLAGVKVMCNTFVKFASAYTDAGGEYEMDMTFSTDIRYRIVFQNVKGFAIGLNKILVPASTSTLGKGSPEGVSITIDKDSDRKLFARSAANNAAYEYFERCEEEGQEIPTPPANTRLWLFQPMESSACLMLQQGVLIDDTFIGKFLGDYGELVKMFLPDVVIGIKELYEYSSIYAQVVHELAHASHYSQAGNEYWNKYADYIAKSFIKSGGRMYGTGAEDNSGYCEVGEMWAYYVQNRLYKERYGEDKSTFGTSYWFKPHILLYLDERGLGRSAICKALKPEVNSRQTLHSSLENLYPDYGTIINQAFERY